MKNFRNKFYLEYSKETGEFFEHLNKQTRESTGLIILGNIIKRSLYPTRRQIKLKILSLIRKRHKFSLHPEWFQGYSGDATIDSDINYQYTNS